MWLRNVMTFVLAVLLVFSHGMHAVAQEAAATSPVVEAEATTAEQAAQEAVTSKLGAVVDAAQANIEKQQFLYEPVHPPVIASAAQRGAQLQYVGSRNGFNGWIVVEKGVPSYTYVSEDGQTVFQGLMYDGEGQPITLGQLAEAQLRNPAFFGAEETETAQSQPGEQAVTTPADGGALAAPQGPGETVYTALGITNIITMGAVNNPAAPVLYAFIDPDCPHCQEFLKAIEQTWLASGKIQLRAIPIGFSGDDSKKRAAYLLSLPNEEAGAALMAHAKGDQKLPARSGLTMAGEELNHNMFTSWKFDGTPILVYRAADGQIMMVRGKPNDPDAVLNAIAAGGGA
jgi:thiol:disulfide interchange protein DsbG